MRPKQIVRTMFWLLVLIGSSVACGNRPASPPPTLVSPSLTPSPTLTATPFQPSPTPIPLAARVNGEAISLADFQAELARYKAARQAAGLEVEAEAGKIVLDDLIDQLLLAQGAKEAGFVMDEAALQARLAELIAEVGGEQALNQWLAKNGYTSESFRTALQRSVAAAWMRDQIAASVPEIAEQVHARQILHYNSELANQTLAQLQAGKDFATLAADADPLTAGDLDWFPRGYLSEPKLEEAAFALQPEQYSEVIQTRFGYHIIQVIERQPQRPLSPDVLLTVQIQALREWLAKRRSQSEIIFYDLPGS
jgi:peptidyl-prolyl cis-trans isomerase C